jgi:hypothetical protein
LSEEKFLRLRWEIASACWWLVAASVCLAVVFAAFILDDLNLGFHSMAMGLFALAGSRVHSNRFDRLKASS